MYPVAPRHNACLGPGVVSAAQMPLDAARCYNADTNAAADAPALIRPAAGGPAFSVQPSDPAKHTTYPYVTGTSVLAVKYADGVMMASDTLGAYGATKRYKSIQRIKPVGAYTLVGAGGEISDFQYISVLLDELMTSDFCADDGHAMSPSEIFAWLTRVMYNRRNKFDPLWNSLVVAGFKDGAPFLGTVSMIGSHYTDAHVATGFGAHLARPLFREKHREDMSAAEARALLEEALRVCYYRDKNSINKFQVATITAAGPAVSEPFALATEWSLKAYQNPSQTTPGTW